MKVVLLERVDNLGAMGDVVDVKPGYARNFLLPKEKALRANPANMARFEAEREILEKRNAEAAAAARESGGHLDGSELVLIRKAGETGILYGSVSARDIAEALEGKISRSMVKLGNPIKTLGVHEVSVRLHAEVEIVVKVNVARTEDEAVRQAKGEDVIETQMEEDRMKAEESILERAEIAAEQMFEGDHGERAVEELSDEASGETTGDTAETKAGEEE